MSSQHHPSHPYSSRPSRHAAEPSVPPPTKTHRSHRRRGRERSNTDNIDLEAHPLPATSARGGPIPVPRDADLDPSKNKSLRSALPDHDMERSDRHGFHLWTALGVALKSSCKLAAATNILLPAVPLGLIFHWTRPDWHLRIFIANYVAMIPMANLLSFAAQEFARKIPRVLGVVLETTFGSAVEIILCLLLLFKDQFQVIQAALIGSMLANLLLCIGLCFIVGGIRYKDQEFDETVAETGGGLLLVSVVGLLIPCAFYQSVSGLGREDYDKLERSVLNISRITSVLLLIAYAIWLLFQLRTHHFLFDRVLFNAEKNNKDRDRKIERKKLSTLEALLFILIALPLVTLHAIFMVEQIHWIVIERGVSDAFMGLILVPLVEKAAEHLTAVDEAYDDSMDFALSHLLGSTIQTALMVSPAIVIVGWIAGKALTLNFEMFMVVVLVLAALVVGNFIKDRKSNYLEGALCVIFYLIIAVTTWFYPDPVAAEGGGH